ncbi:MAG: hypothetical protein H6582_12410 [Crocinitomicaceae bacterium]|nr:hypothetical protein [Crocinitomicaceae bacterium]
MKTSLIIAFVVVLTSCAQKEEIIVVADQKFEIPKIKVGSLDSSFKLMADTMSSASSMLVGRYGFDAEVDLTQNFGGARRSIYQYYTDSIRKMIYELPSDGFQIYVDYSQDIPVPIWNKETTLNCFPVFVVNETKHTKAFHGKDSYLFCTQEAKMKYNFYPVSHVPFDFCGHGHYLVPVLPQQYMLFLLPKYEGNMKTEMRITLQMNGILYRSKPFMGTVDSTQFLLSKFWYDDDEDQLSFGTISHYFNGAPPLKNRYTQSVYMVY